MLGEMLGSELLLKSYYTPSLITGQIIRASDSLRFSPEIQDFIPWNESKYSILKFSIPIFRPNYSRLLGLSDQGFIFPWLYLVTRVMAGGSIASCVSIPSPPLEGFNSTFQLTTVGQLLPAPGFNSSRSSSFNLLSFSLQHLILSYNPISQETFSMPQKPSGIVCNCRVQLFIRTHPVGSPTNGSPLQLSSYQLLEPSSWDSLRGELWLEYQFPQGLWNHLQEFSQYPCLIICLFKKECHVQGLLCKGLVETQ